jgi:hypothetical protein
LVEPESVPARQESEYITFAFSVFTPVLEATFLMKRPKH